MRWWVILAAVSAVGVGGTSQIPAPRDGVGKAEQQSDTAKQHKDSEGTKTPADARAPEGAHQDAISSQTEEESRWYTSPDWWVAGGTGALVLVTAGLWLFTALLWRATKLAVADTAVGIKVATDTLAHAQMVSERELRAYVMVTLQGASMAGKSPGAAVEVYNRGKTPAHDVCVRWSLFTGTAGIAQKDVDAIEQSATNPEDARMLLGPDEHRGANVLVDEFNEDEIAAVRNRSEFLYVIGCVDYTDAFGHRRHTRFCHRYQGSDLGEDAGTYGHYGNSYT
jgi:hypothetical protein